MRNGCLAALTVLLASPGLAFAQQFPDPVACEPLAPPAATSSAGWWGSAEYLFWWTRSGRVPPLVTGGGDGVPGSPGTRVLVDDLNFDDNVRHGGRFALGYRFETVPCLGVEANYFFLGDRRGGVSFSSGGDPVLGRPYVNATTGRPAATLISMPGVAAGTVAVGARTSLWGAEANLTAGLTRSDTFHLTALGGFRFLGVEDELTIGEHFVFAGSTVGLADAFRTDNRFYGGQVGLEAGVRHGRLTLDLRGKLGLGGMRQVARVSGVTDARGPDGSRTIFTGGLLALRSNIGRHQRDELAFVPEVGLNVGWQLTRHARLYAGYTFLWVSTVARAGEQIDPVVNVTQFPILSGNGPLVGAARPAFGFAGSDFWAQGLNLGLELRY